MNLFTQIPEWLRGALGTTQPQLPHELDTGQVIPVLDMYQGGWSQSRFSTHVASQPASSPAQNATIIEAAEDLVRVVMAGWATYTGGGGGGAVSMRLRDTVLNQNVFLYNEAGPVTFWSLHQNGGARPAIVPPGYALWFSLPATAAGETWEARFLILTVPRGSNPL